MTLTEAMVKFELAEVLHGPIGDGVSDKPPDQTKAEDVAYASQEDIAELTSTIKSKTAEGQERPLNLAEKGNIKKFFAKLKAFMTGNPPVQKQAAPQAGKTEIQVPKPHDITYSFTDVLAQGAGGTFKTLPRETLHEIREQYRQALGSDPNELDKPSDVQLSALSAWMTADHGTVMGGNPFVDFAIWGPFNQRTMKARHFGAMVMTTSGHLQHKQVKGPQSYEEWESCWRVFKTAGVMLSMATPAAFDAYQEGIKFLNTIYKGNWASVLKWDEDMRELKWPDLVADIASGRHQPQNCSTCEWNPTLPWDYILRATRPTFVTGPLAEWWTKNRTLLDMAKEGVKDVKPADLGIAAPPSITTAAGQQKGDGKRWGNRKGGKNHPQPKQQPSGRGAWTANTRPWKKVKIQCNICGGDHFAAGCPWRNEKGDKGGKGGNGKNNDKSGKGKANHKGGKGKGGKGKASRPWSSK